MVYNLYNFDHLCERGQKRAFLYHLSIYLISSTYLLSNPQCKTRRGVQKKFLLVIRFFYVLLCLVQLNLNETNLLFRYLSHHLTWHCSSISGDLHRFARNLQHLSVKLRIARLKLFRNNNKNNFALIWCKFLANLCKSS